MRIEPGDWVTIQWRANTARNLSEFPREAACRMAKCTKRRNADNVTLWFPYPVKLTDRSMTHEITLPERGMFYHMKKETIVDTDFPAGPTEGTVMVPVATVYEKYWSKFGAEDQAWTYKDSSWPLQAAIEAEGLRAPIVLGHDLGVRYGSHRVLAYSRMGREYIEAYVTSDPPGRVKVRVPPIERARHGCVGRLA